MVVAVEVDLPLVRSTSSTRHFECIQPSSCCSQDGLISIGMGLNIASWYVWLSGLLTGPFWGNLWSAILVVETSLTFIANASIESRLWLLCRHFKFYIFLDLTRLTRGRACVFRWYHCSSVQRVTCNVLPRRRSWGVHVGRYLSLNVYKWISLHCKLIPMSMALIVSWPRHQLVTESLGDRPGISYSVMCRLRSCKERALHEMISHAGVLDLAAMLNMHPCILLFVIVGRPQVHKGEFLE